jgi:hypothetical protein
VANWLLVGILIIAELAIVVRIPVALVQGAVPLNPLGWIGYSEYLQVSVDREDAPAAYWTIICLVTAMALVFGYFIYYVATSIG